MSFPIPDSFIYSVGSYTKLIKNLLEKNIPGSWIRGEVSNLRKQSSGHVYFTLKDPESQLSCVLFKGDYLKNGLDLREGMQILLYGDINLFEPRGNYQLIAKFALPDGIGKLQQAFDALKNKLNNEGLFDRSLKPPIPTLPLNIAVITSPTGAAIKDFLSILSRRSWRGHITIFPSKVQGDGASSEIIQQLNRIHSLPPFDLIILTRGGGSIEDLWPFNDESLVRTVASSKIPIISAVGHEIDFTLTDFAASLRAETPSAAAEIISSLFLNLHNRLSLSTKHLLHSTQNNLQNYKLHLNTLSSSLSQHSPIHLFQKYSLILDDLSSRLHLSLKKSLETKHASLLHAQQQLKNTDPSPLLHFHKNHLTNLQKRLLNLGVEKTLNRGFTIASTSNGQLLSRKNQIPPNSSFSITFADGSITVSQNP